MNSPEITQECMDVFSKFVTSLHDVNYDPETQIQLFSLDNTITTIHKIPIHQLILNLIHSSVFSDSLTCQTLHKFFLHGLSKEMIKELQQILLRLKIQTLFNEHVMLICIKIHENIWSFCIARKQNHTGIFLKDMLTTKRGFLFLQKTKDSLKHELQKMIDLGTQHSICLQNNNMLNYFEIEFQTLVLHLRLNIHPEWIVQIVDPNCTDEVRIIWMIQLNMLFKPVIKVLFKQELQDYFEPEHRLDYFIQVCQSIPDVMERCFSKLSKLSSSEFRQEIIQQLKD
jgi:hypothetical protein